jgi:hypothetical protein
MGKNQTKGHLLDERRVGSTLIYKTSKRHGQAVETWQMTVLPGKWPVLSAPRIFGARM